MFLIMGFIHIVAGFVLLITGSDATLYLSQGVGGLLELSIGIYLFLQELDA
jgi:hypothetical protein